MNTPTLMQIWNDFAFAIEDALDDLTKRLHEHGYKLAVHLRADDGYLIVEQIEVEGYSDDPA